MHGSRPRANLLDMASQVSTMIASGWEVCTWTTPLDKPKNFDVGVIPGYRFKPGKVQSLQNLGTCLVYSKEPGEES
jgi:hypothetical protein